MYSPTEKFVIPLLIFHPGYIKEEVKTPHEIFSVIILTTWLLTLHDIKTDEVVVV